MSGDFQLLPLHDARADMVLADAVRDAKGNVLLVQGVVLTSPMLAALARHGIAALPILRAGAPARPVDMTAVQARLDYVFRGNDRDDMGDWATGILRRYVEDYRLQREVTP